MNGLKFRRAAHADLPAIVRLLALENRKHTHRELRMLVGTVGKCSTTARPLRIRCSAANVRRALLFRCTKHLLDRLAVSQIAGASSRSFLVPGRRASRTAGEPSGGMPEYGKLAGDPAGGHTGLDHDRAGGNGSSAG